MKVAILDFRNDETLILTEVTNVRVVGGFFHIQQAGDLEGIFAALDTVKLLRYGEKNDEPEDEPIPTLN